MADFGKEISLDDAVAITNTDSGEVQGFIFDLDLVEAFINSAKKQDPSAKYLVAIKAINSNPIAETIVLAAATSSDKINFNVVTNESNMVLEHPKDDGIITFSE